MKSNEMIVVGGAKRKRIEDGLGSEQGDYGKGQMPGGWAPSLKMVSRMKQKSLGTFKGMGYNKETIKSVRELINVYEHPGEGGTSSSSWFKDLSESPSTLGEYSRTWATGNWRGRGSYNTNTEREACRPSTTYYGGSTAGN